MLAAIDPGTEVPRMLAASGGGVAVPPDDLEAFCGALAELLHHPDQRRQMGESARNWVTGAASPAAVALQYEQLVGELA